MKKPPNLANHSRHSWCRACFRRSKLQGITQRMRQVFLIMASHRSLLAVLLLFCVGLTPVYADTDRGLEIAKTMRERR